MNAMVVASMAFPPLVIAAAHSADAVPAPAARALRELAERDPPLSAAAQGRAHRRRR